MSGTGRIVAFDVGDARVGVAMSDPLGMIAQPLCTIDRANGGMEKLADLVAEKAAKKVVVGLPLELSGEIGSQAKKVEAFVERFKTMLRRKSLLQSIEIVFWDERFSTGQAERVLAGSGLKNRDCHAALDRVSAAVILESYINSL